jgi:hypothetical protein
MAPHPLAGRRDDGGHGFSSPASTTRPRSTGLRLEGTAFGFNYGPTLQLDDVTAVEQR